MSKPPSVPIEVRAADAKRLVQLLTNPAARFAKDNPDLSSQNGVPRSCRYACSWVPERLLINPWMYTPARRIFIAGGSLAACFSSDRQPPNQLLIAPFETSESARTRFYRDWSRPTFRRASGWRRCRGVGQRYMDISRLEIPRCTFRIVGR